MARKPKVVVTSLPFPVPNSEETSSVPIPNARLEWMLDPYKDESELAYWICWDSKCGRYRIVWSFGKYDDSRLYRAGILRGGAIAGIITSDAKSLRAVLEAVERHHCKNFKLEGVESNAESVIQRHEENLRNNFLDNLIPSRYTNGQYEGQRGTSTNSRVKENVMKVDAKVAVSLVEQLGLTKAKELVKEGKIDKVTNFLKNTNSVYDPEDDKTTINGDKENALLQKLLKLKEGEEIELVGLKSVTKSEEEPEGEKVTAKASKNGKAEKPSKNGKANPEAKAEKNKEDAKKRRSLPSAITGKDKFGCTLGGVPAQINAKITTKPRTPEQIAEACQVPLPKVKVHLKFWLKRDVGLAETDGKYFVKS